MASEPGLGESTLNDQGLLTRSLQASLTYCSSHLEQHVLESPRLGIRITTIYETLS
jgi:hypothetical protein